MIESKEGVRWLTLEQRGWLEEKYGPTAVIDAERHTPKGDIGLIEAQCKFFWADVKGEPTREIIEWFEKELARIAFEEGPIKYVTVVNPGDTVFYTNDVISNIALGKENHRVRELGKEQATYTG